MKTQRSLMVILGAVSIGIISSTARAGLVCSPENTNGPWSEGPNCFAAPDDTWRPGSVTLRVEHEGEHLLRQKEEMIKLRSNHPLMSSERRQELPYPIFIALQRDEHDARGYFFRLSQESNKKHHRKRWEDLKNWDDHKKIPTPKEPIEIKPVPLPATWSFLVGGLLLFGFILRFHDKAETA